MKATRHGPWRLPVAILAGAAFFACEVVETTTGPDDLAPSFDHRPGHGGKGGKPGGGNDGGGDSGGDGTVTVTLSEGAVGEHAGKELKETNRSITISGGPESETTFSFTGALGVYEAGGCTAAHGSPDGPALDATTAAMLANFLTAETATSLAFTYDKRADGQVSADHDLTFHTFDDQGRRVHIGIFAHGNPAPTIERVADGFLVSRGVVRVWLRDGPPKNHPKLFCGNHGDTIKLTIE